MMKQGWFHVVYLIIFCWHINAWANAPKPVRFVKTDQKVVALTFDDGPSTPYTEQVLDILERHHVKATFYVLGVNVKTYPYIIKRMINQGHELGNHSMYHHYLKKKSVKQIEAEILQVDALIRKQGYDGQITFRSPFGQVSKGIQQAVYNLDKTNVLFSYLSEDWEGPPAQVIHDRIMKRVRPGFIITLHDGGKGRHTTVQATERLIQTLKQQGYQFVLISDLLKMGPWMHVYH